MPESRRPVTRTEAIKNLLTTTTLPDLAALYNADMEVQVAVAQDGGQRIQKDFMGRNYGVYTDGRTEWKSFRIPRNAGKDPSDNDGPMTFNLAEHLEGIGCTGWDWRNRVSKWRCMDLDSIVGHAEGHRGKLTDEELAEVKQKAMGIPWVTVRFLSPVGEHTMPVAVTSEPTARAPPSGSIASSRSYPAPGPARGRSLVQGSMSTRRPGDPGTVRLRLGFGCLPKNQWSPLVSFDVYFNKPGFVARPKPESFHR